MRLTRTIRAHPPLLRLIQALLLMGWLLSAQGVVPALCWMVAVMDGEHGVAVRASQAGDVSVVLSHDSRVDEADSMNHQHDVICRIIVALARKPQTGEADHVIAFKSVEDGARTLRRASENMTMPALSVVFLPSSSLLMRVWTNNQAVRQDNGRAWSPGAHVRCGMIVLRC